MGRVSLSYKRGLVYAFDCLYDRIRSPVFELWVETLSVFILVSFSSRTLLTIKHQPTS